MKVYMSLWTNGMSFSNTQINLWKLSLALAKKHYVEVDLVTDTNGYELMKDLPFTNFHVELNDIPDYPTVWCLGKIYTYKFACENNEAFLHLDGDVLLWEKLPEELSNSPIFVQSYDFNINEHPAYDVIKLQQDLGSATPVDWLAHGNLTSFNMGIFGGTNLALINDYCDYAISMINNPLYHRLWSSLPGGLSYKDGFISSTTKSCMLEQANLAIFCKNNNVVPSRLFDNREDPNKTTYKKYSHLIMNKHHPIILHNVEERLSQDPYDLEPKDVPIESWHEIQ